MKMSTRIGIGAAMCLAGAALAANQESVAFTSKVSNGINGSGLNQVSQNIFTGFYPVHRVRVHGTLVSGGVNSYASEARILVTPPTGQPFILQPFSIPGGFGTVTTPPGGYVFDLPSVVPSAHGTWTWRFFESYDDTDIDATWSSISFSLDDGTGTSGLEAYQTAAPVVAGVSSTLMSLYIVPGTNPASTGIAASMNLSSVGGAASQAMFDDGTHGDVVAGDHIYSYRFSPAASVPEGSYDPTFSVTDAQGRHLASSMALDVQGVTDMGGVDELGNGYVTSAAADLSYGGVHWFKVTIPAVAAVSQGWLDVWSYGPVDGDTEIGVYDASGTLMGSDDDSGGGFLSALSFGQATPIRTIPNGGAPGNGRNGALPAGTYYIAYGMYPMTFGSTNWSATSTGLGETGGGISVWLGYRTNPTVTGNKTVVPPQGTALVTAHALEGFDPISEGLNVSADFNAFGGSTPNLYDDGTHGDQYAGDHVFSMLYTLPPGYGEGIYTIPLLVRDSLFRQGTGTATIYVDAVGDLPPTAKTLNNVDGVHSVSGVVTAGDVDMYRIHICDPAHFSAISTIPNFDSVLYLFRLDGTGIAMTDDSGPPFIVDARLEGPVVTSIAAGDYYLAITHFSQHPFDAFGQLLWHNNGYGYTVQPPDGPGAANPVASWDSFPYMFGYSYSIAFTGVSGRACPGHCSPDFNGDGDVGTDGDIEAFFACLAGACCPTCGSADFNGDGDVGTDADIEAFFRVLAGGAC